MEKIQFGNYGDRYSIESIQPVATHVLRIVYASNIPPFVMYDEDIIIYSQGDIKETTLTGWNTVYYYDEENRTVYLSDDGSVWTEPEPEPETEPEPTPEPEPYEPTLEEVQSYKISEMESTRDSYIKHGTDVDGEHFSLDSNARLALIARQHRIDIGEAEIDFYPDGMPSRYYTAEEMQNIIDTVNEFINGHEVYCNELVLWIESLTDIEEVEAVYYGMDIPVEHRSEVLEKMLPVGDDETGMIPQEGEPDDDKPDDPEAPDDPDEPDSGDDSNIGAGGELDVGGDN